jgi:hypothetical protein
MDQPSELVQVLTILAPVLTALVGLLGGYLQGLGKGKRTPRREEVELRTRVDALAAIEPDLPERLERARSSSSIPPPPPTVRDQ